MYSMQASWVNKQRIIEVMYIFWKLLKEKSRDAQIYWIFTQAEIKVSLWVTPRWLTGVCRFHEEVSSFISKVLAFSYFLMSSTELQEEKKCHTHLVPCILHYIIACSIYSRTHFAETRLALAALLPQQVRLDFQKKQFHQHRTRYGKLHLLSSVSRIKSIIVWQ